MAEFSDLDVGVADRGSSIYSTPQRENSVETDDSQPAIRPTVSVNVS